MAIPMIAISASALLATPLIIALFRLTKPGWVRYIGFALVSVLFFCLSLFSFEYLRDQTTHSRFDAEPEEIFWLEIPDDAKSVSYLSSHGPTAHILEFNVSKESFSDWMNSQGRVAKPIVDPIEIRQLDRDEPNRPKAGEVVSGFHWDDYESSSDDSGTTIIFDESTGKTHVRVQMW